MYMGAFIGFLTGLYTESLVLSLLAAFAAGVFGSLIYAFLTVTLKANQNVTGLTLTIFGTGFANFFGEMLIAANKKLTIVFICFRLPRPLCYRCRCFSSSEGQSYSS